MPYSIEVPYFINSLEIIFEENGHITKDNYSIVIIIIKNNDCFLVALAKYFQVRVEPIFGDGPMELT